MIPKTSRASSGRPGRRDADDIRLLLDHLGIGAVHDVISVVERYFPDDPLSDRSRMLIMDLLR